MGRVREMRRRRAGQGDGKKGEGGRGRGMGEAAMAPRVWGGGHYSSSKMDKGRFSDMSSDPRHTMATHRHNDQKRTNIGTSFDPASMNCYTCANHHPIQEGGGGGD